MTSSTIAIVGATGKTGARVLTRLSQMGASTRALARNTAIRFDWADRDTWGPALQGADSAYVTYFPDLAIPQAEDDIRAFIEVARTQGVRHIVLLSGRGEAGAQRAEAVIAASGMDWNIVRASWFMQNFSESFMLDGIRSGELVLPEPKAEEPFIDVDDIADVAVAALTRPELRNQLLEVTGPEILSFAQCVELIAAESARSIAFTTVPVEAYLANAKAQGLPDDIAWLINELFVNVLDGRNANTTPTVEQILGRPAKTFQQYVTATVKTGVWTSTRAETHEKYGT